MVSFFIQNAKSNKIEALEIDTTITENHEFTNIITSYPVDIGFNISDHVQQQQPKLSITALTSNTPVQYFSGQISRLVRKDLTSKIQETFRLLINYAGFQIPKHAGADSIQPIDPKLLTIVTGYNVYRNMFIQKISFPRDKSTGDSIQYNIEFTQIRKVSSKYSFISNASSLNGKAPGIEKQADKTKNIGKETLEEVPEESLPYKGFQFLKGKLGRIIQ